MACGGDRLSDLPDELLLRILHFLPVKEAASTAALSRRWRSPLWRSSAAVNLATRIQNSNRCYALFSAAEAALDAADVPVTRLTLRLEFVDHGDCTDMFLHRDRDTDDDSDGSTSPDRDLLAKLLSHQAARRVEELRIAAEDRYIGDVDKDDEVTSSWWQVGIFKLNLGSLSSETLRVLDITNCQELVPPPPETAVVFRRLSTLRLCHCSARNGALQSLFDASPALAAVHLESIVVIAALPTDDDASDSDTADSPLQQTKALLCCPAATALVLDRCYWKQRDDPWSRNYAPVAVEINAPRLRRFTYKGLLRPLSLSQPPPDLARADLHFVQHPQPRSRRDLCRTNNNPYRDQESERALVTFWRFVKSFTNVKELKLTVNGLEHIAVRRKARSLELLPVLANVHRLEVQGVHRPTGNTAAVAIANLLCCCPALRDLRIDLMAISDPQQHFCETNDRAKSIRDLNRYNCSAPTTVSLEGIAVNANYDDVSEIPCLIGRSFDCLQSSMKRVALQFRSEEANCLGVKLIKFFVENAMVLEEMYIDGGNEKLGEHMTRKVERWIAYSSIKRKPGASRFVVLPLKRL